MPWGVVWTIYRRSLAPTRRSESDVGSQICNLRLVEDLVYRPAEGAGSVPFMNTTYSERLRLGGKRMVAESCESSV